MRFGECSEGGGDPLDTCVGQSAAHGRGGEERGLFFSISISLPGLGVSAAPPDPLSCPALGRKTHSCTFEAANHSCWLC